VSRLVGKVQGLAYLSNFMTYESLASGKSFFSVLSHQVIRPNLRELVDAVFDPNTSLASRIRVFLDLVEDNWNACGI